MPTVKFSPSVNIIRDAKRELQYIVTPNAQRVALTITDSFKKGIHAFTLIGSYGTGKSSFLWALQQTLLGNKALLDCAITAKDAPVKVINIVGAYQSLIEYFTDEFDVKNNLKANQNILDAIFQEYNKIKNKNGLLVIAIDEFGKFLEYAVKHDPDRELYFIQQLAEFVNDANRNILLVTTLHQNFEAYSTNELTQAQAQEWRKVKGRLREITFNEPIEQLLLLAAKALQSKPKHKGEAELVRALEEKHFLLGVDKDVIEKFGDSLRPLDFFSAFVLAKALQRYGQNERSLFTFLELESFKSKELFGLAEVYDYLYQEFYSYITSRNNVDYTLWALTRAAIERAENQVKHAEVAVKILKTIALLKLFGSGDSKIDKKFLPAYFKLTGYKGDVLPVIDELVKKQIILLAKYTQSYKIFEGTDVNIEEELLQAAKEVPDEIDVPKKLKEHIDFGYLTAKSVTYTKGTPRFFEFRIHESLIKEKPEGEIDGFISLIFNTDISLRFLKDFSGSTEEAVLFGYFNNADTIREALYDIEKTKVVMARNLGDPVANRELKSILRAQESLLSHYVEGAFYTEDVVWVYGGKEVSIKNKKQLNQQLSTICDDVYALTPVFQNELINKHAISGAIHGARREYLNSLAANHSQEDFGFDKNLFPPEKTIYTTLLKETGIHVNVSKSEWDFNEPGKRSTFFHLWQASEAFLNSCKSERKPLSVFFQILSEKPYKLKQGFLEFWIPTYLFIKRDDFALFGDKGYIPELNDAVLYMLIRNTKEFYLKTFDVKGVKLNLYNKYREFLLLNKEKKVSNQSFIESIRPFLVMYKQLPEYAKKTTRLSPETLAIRKAIENSQDPEKVFFEDFPKALKTDIKKLSSSNSTLTEYIENLQNVIRELRSCVSDLRDRIELFLTQKVLGDKKLKFSAYKALLQKRYAKLEDYRLLPKQSAFLSRINSPLDDRDSWLNSVVQAVVGKQIDSLTDTDEEILKDRLLFMVQEMDNLTEMSVHKKDAQSSVIKIDVTTEDHGLSKTLVTIPKGLQDDVKKLKQEVKKLLSKDKRINLAGLSELLKDQLDK